jgi:tripartite-type tricarboxylate transporter receptor subunit TctC
MRRREFLPVMAAVALAPPAFAWPDQPIRMIVPFTPAGGPDLIARYVGERLPPRLGQPMVVENIPGASGNIGSQLVARAKPDGHTLMSSVNTLVMNASLYRNLPYDPVTDFAPITLSAWGTLVLVAHPARPTRTLDELVSAARAAPRSLTYASPGVGTPHHLAMALLETTTSIELLHVPYKGAAGALQDIVGGQVDYMVLPVHVAAPHIRNGKLKALAVGSPRRAPLLADVPTFAEAGLEGLDVDMWYGFFAPKDTPADIVSRLNKEIAAVLGTEEARIAFEAQGLLSATSSAVAFAEIVARDRLRWSEVVAKRDIKAE